MKLKFNRKIQRRSHPQDRKRCKNKFNNKCWFFRVNKLSNSNLNSNSTWWLCSFNQDLKTLNLTTLDSKESSKKLSLASGEPNHFLIITFSKALLEQSTNKVNIIFQIIKITIKTIKELWKLIILLVLVLASREFRMLLITPMILIR